MVFLVPLSFRRSFENIRATFGNALAQMKTSSFLTPHDIWYKDPLYLWNFVIFSISVCLLASVSYQWVQTRILFSFYFLFQGFNSAVNTCQLQKDTETNVKTLKGGFAYGQFPKTIPVQPKNDEDPLVEYAIPGTLSKSKTFISFRQLGQVFGRSERGSRVV